MKPLNQGDGMSKAEEFASKSRTRVYLTSSALGITRVLVGFPFEHPIDSIKTQW